VTRNNPRPDGRTGDPSARTRLEKLRKEALHRLDVLLTPKEQRHQLEQQCLDAARYTRSTEDGKQLKPGRARPLYGKSKLQQLQEYRERVGQATPGKVDAPQLSTPAEVLRLKDEDERLLWENRELQLANLALWQRLHHADRNPDPPAFGSGSLVAASRLAPWSKSKKSHEDDHYARGLIFRHCKLCGENTLQLKGRYDRKFVCIRHGLVAEIERRLAAPPARTLHLSYWSSDGSRGDDPRSDEEKASQKLRWEQALRACGGHQADAEHRLTQEMAARWRQALAQCAGKPLAAKRMLKQQGAIQEWLTTTGDTARFVSNLRSAWPAIVRGIQTDARVRRLSRGRFTPEPANKRPGGNQDWLKQHDPTHKTANTDSQPEKPADPTPPAPSTTPQEEKPAPRPRQRTTLPLGRMQSSHGFMKLRELRSASGQPKRRGRPRDPVLNHLLAEAEITPAGTRRESLRIVFRSAGFSDAEIEVRITQLEKLLLAKRRRAASQSGGAAA
jgi:hypothetical protein